MQVEAEMLSMIPEWEEANGRPFMVQGERVVDKIYQAMEEKEAAKEAKKVSLLEYQVSSTVEQGCLLSHPCDTP